MLIDNDKNRIISTIEAETLTNTISVIPDVLAQHADTAAALALNRFYAVQSSDYDLSDLKKLESRLEGNLDGLFISGNEGWPFYNKHLSADEYGEIFVKAELAIKLKSSERFESTFEAAADNEELLNAITDAFIWLPYKEIAFYLDLLYKIQKPEKQFVAIAASAGHGVINIEHLKDALTSTNIPLRRRALFAVAELGEEELKTCLIESLDHEDSSIQFAACWALTRFGNANAMQRLESFLTDPIYGERAIQLVAMQKDVNKTINILRELFKTKETKRLSIFGMGLLGNPRSIEPLIQLMYDPELARVAGEAFSFITGVDLDYEDLNQDAPEGVELGPNDDPKDGNVAMDVDEDLPWPNPQLIAGWWQQNKNRFDPNKKYILGREESVAQYKNVLITGTQKQRAFAALVIAAHQQNQPIFNVYGPAKRQMQLLGI